MKNKQLNFLILSILLSNVSLVDAAPSKQEKPPMTATQKVGIGIGSAFVLALVGYPIYHIFFKSKKPSRFSLLYPRQSVGGEELKEIQNSPHQLLVAFNKGDVGRIEELVKAGVRFQENEFPRMYEKNMLHSAINMHPQDNQPKVVEIVLAAMQDEIDINEPNQKGVPPLFMVIHNIQQSAGIQGYFAKMQAIINILIEHGADTARIGPLSAPPVSSSIPVACGTLFDAADKIENENIRNAVKSCLKYRGARTDPLL